MFKLDQSVIDLLNRFFAKAYKVIGFVILTSILGGLVCYFALNAYYLTSTHWLAPTKLSASNEKVIQLNEELTQQMLRLDKLESKKRQRDAERHHIERALDAQNAYRDQLQAALDAEVQARRHELTDLRGLAADFENSQELSKAALQNHRDFNVERLTDEYEANLIDRQAFVDGIYSLSRIENSRLTRQTRQIEVAAKRALLQRQLAALEAAGQQHDGQPGADTSGADASGANTTGAQSSDRQPTQPSDAAADDAQATPFTFEVVSMQRKYRDSELQTARLKAQQRTMKQHTDVLDESIDRYQRIQAEIRNSPYLRAMNEQVSIAFVPYANLDDIQPGAKVYGCSLGMLWCSQVGAVDSILDGEVTARHPLYNEQVRGQMVELNLDEPGWAEQDALFAGGAPFLL